MQIYEMEISDVKIIEPDVHQDHRGYLAVPVSIRAIEQQGIPFRIVQINQGYSIKPYTIRGLHFQCEPYAQAKLISANQGTFFSVAVDLRSDSATFGKWCGAVISADNHKVMYVPRGFAHGYLTMEPHTILQYCVDNEYNGELARALKYDDADVAIEWPADIDITTLTDKDIHAMSLQEIHKKQY